MRPDPVPRTVPAGATARLWPWWLGWVVFVVYGSLVPLDYRPVPLDLAWQRLVQAPLLDVGVQGRADWIANGVLYFPVGFLAAGMWAGEGRRSAARRIAATAAAVAFGVALAVAVEFAQTAFPPRTVSRNDLLAESLGTLLGALAAQVGAGGLRQVLAGFAPGGGVLAWRLGLAYAVVFPAIAMFPFDFLLDAAEWRDKLAGSGVGLWLADSALEMGGVRLTAKLAVETLAVAPLGALWAYWRTARRSRPASVTMALLLGASLGLSIEIGQLTIASGQSQGASVLTRALGFAVGALAWRRRSDVHPEALRAWIRRRSWPLLTANLVALVVLSGTWRGPWLDADSAWHRLAVEVRFVPFYYHYYTTEMQAVVSLIAVGLSYAPLGLLGWAWGAARSGVTTVAALLALLVESAKIFSTFTHPDPTNLVIAGAAAWIAQALLQQLNIRSAWQRSVQP